MIVAAVYDKEDWSYMTDPNVWSMIEKRRQETGLIPLERVKAETDEEIRVIGARRSKKASSASALKRNNKGKPHGSA